MSSLRRYAVCSVALALCTHASRAQQPLTASAPAAHTGSNWESVKALPSNTRVHITADHGSRTCRIFAVTEDALTCAKAGGAGAVVQRADIRHIRLAHYVRSSLVGAGIGGGIGAVSGAIAGRSKPCPSGQNLCFNGIGIGPGGVAAVFGVGGAVLGSIVGGVTDMSRGSTIYTRP